MGTGVTAKDESADETADEEPQQRGAQRKGDDGVAHPEGLTDVQAAQRLSEVGPNVITEHKVSPVGKFLRSFWGPIPWMIEIAAILSAVVRHWADLVIIVVLLLFNAVIGFWQEHKADTAIAMLKKKLALRARVLRGGSWKTIAASDIVPDDVIRVRLGEIVPADVELTAGDGLEVDQSALTGESLPVEKHIGDVAYSGSVVHRGEADAVVTATGMNTYFGKTARLVEEAKTTSHYQQAVLRIGRFLILITILLVALIVSVAIYRGTPLLETLQFCLILTVAAIPVALPAVLSVTMAVGAIQLARRQAIVSRLVSIEEMAGMDLLCSDKTGTLTQNRLKLGDPVVLADVSPEQIITFAALASRYEDRDPIELPIFEGLRGGVATLEEYQVQDFHPFDPVTKRSEADVEHAGVTFKVSKGAAQAVLELCDDRDQVRGEVNRRVDEMASRGYRALAVARTDDAGKWRFQGLLSLFDPPREDSADTIRAANGMGVTVKMVTGDHVAIAKETARNLHMGTRILPVGEVFSSSQDVDTDRIAAADGFAQVFPEHKYRIVEAMQKAGHIVGMTGDGVNDAPALRKADMGVAVAGSTDAARSAADLVLTAPGLSVIIDAVKQARQIFRRMNSYAIYRIAETVRVLLFMTACILIFDFYPVTAIMIVMLALLNDGPIMTIAYDRTDLPQSPTRWNMRYVLTIAAVLGVLGVTASFLLFLIGERVMHLSRPVIQTLMFLKLTVAGHMTIYLARTGEYPFWKKPLPAPILFFTTESTQLVATLFAVFGILMEPIGWKLGLLVWGYSLAWFVLNDQIKVQVVRLLKRRTRPDAPMTP